MSEISERNQQQITSIQEQIDQFERLTEEDAGVDDEGVQSRNGAAIMIKALHNKIGMLSDPNYTDWDGVEGASEHRTTGLRAWCFQDSEWCAANEESWCPCCNEAAGREQYWFDPKVGPPERVILRDLIAELRNLEASDSPFEPAVVWFRDVVEAAARAEKRLRKMQGE